MPLLVIQQNSDLILIRIHLEWPFASTLCIFGHWTRREKNVTDEMDEEKDEAKEEDEGWCWHSCS